VGWGYWTEGDPGDSDFVVQPVGGAAEVAVEPDGRGLGHSALGVVLNNSYL
jgi:hypothetical protein